MEFVKKHFEKIILMVVLGGLAVAVALLPLRIDSERVKLKEKIDTIVGKTNRYSPLNLAELDTTIKRMTNQAEINLSGGHNLFAPVKWQVTPTGERIKVATGKEVGPAALAITAVSPLYYTINLERVAGNSYVLGTTQETAARPKDREKKTHYASTNSPKTPLFLLKTVNGPVEAPNELILELPGENKELVSVSKEKPYRRVESYTVDLKYAPENLAFSKKRTNEVVSFAGDDYIIVDITTNGIVLLSQSSTRRIPVKYNTAP